MLELCMSAMEVLTRPRKEIIMKNTYLFSIIGVAGIVVITGSEALIALGANLVVRVITGIWVNWHAGV
jgi:hypothetical protein